MVPVRMPWIIEKRPDHCSPEKPWAVVKQGGDGAIEGCHVSEEHAKRQLAALYANEPGAGRMDHERMAATVEQLIGGGMEEADALAAVFAGTERAEWTAAYINDLPDSSFAFIESGGTKDDAGKTTPRSLRHFPIKDANGTCDGPHTANALARAPQSPFGNQAMPKIRACARALNIGQPAAGNGGRSNERQVPRKVVENHPDCPPDKPCAVVDENGDKLACYATMQEAKDAMAPGRGQVPPGMSEREAAFKLERSGDGNTLEGYAAVFDSPADIEDLLGEYTEVIKPGAFKRTLRSNSNGLPVRPPPLMFQHGRHPLIGPMPIGTFQELREDERGLYMRARLFDNWLIDPLRDAIREQAVWGMSFRFEVPEGQEVWTRDTRGRKIRTVRELKLYELGPVVFPAYEQATIALRSLEARVPNIHISVDGEDGEARCVDCATDDRGQERQTEKPQPGNYPCSDPNGDGACDHCGQPCSAHQSARSADSGNGKVDPVDEESLKDIEARLVALETGATERATQATTRSADEAKRSEDDHGTSDGPGPTAPPEEPATHGEPGSGEIHLPTSRDERLRYGRQIELEQRGIRTRR